MKQTHAGPTCSLMTWTSNWHTRNGQILRRGWQFCLKPFVDSYKAKIE